MRGRVRYSNVPRSSGSVVGGWGRARETRGVSHQGGAGESGFCYEAGASVEVAPVDALLTSPLATAAPAKPEALPAVPCEDERRTRERDEGNAQRDVEEHEVEEEEE